MLTSAHKSPTCSSCVLVNAACPSVSGSSRPGSSVASLLWPLSLTVANAASGPTCLPECVDPGFVPQAAEDLGLLGDCWELIASAYDRERSTTAESVPPATR
jgi:hypothetical protein